MSTRTESPGASQGTRPESKFRSYVHLGKLDVYDYYLSILIALSAAAFPLSRFGADAVAAMGAFLVGEVLVIVALVALDDVTGYRDGSDGRNYGPDNPLRKKLRKPLVAGTLTETEALRFAWITATLGALAWGASVAVAPHRPMWTLVLIAVTFVLALQYSYGLKISYRGFQEIYLVVLGAALVLGPLGLATGMFSGFWLVQAVLFGFGPLMFGVYSNTNDVEGDRSVGRPTVAALVSARGNARFIGALSLVEFLLGAVASATGVAPWWFVLVMLPATGLRAKQYYTAFRVGDIMTARKTGFAVHRTAVVLMIVANLLVAWSAV